VLAELIAQMHAATAFSLVYHTARMRVVYGEIEESGGILSPSGPVGRKGCMDDEQ